MFLLNKTKDHSCRPVNTFLDSFFYHRYMHLFLCCLTQLILRQVEQLHAEMDGGHTHIAMAMEQWKQHPNPGPECLMPSFLTDQFPPDPLAEDGSGNEAGFEKHGLSVAVGSPQDEGKPAQLTPHFGGRMSGSSSSLSERMQARNGFSVPKLSMPFATPAGDDSEQSGVQPPIFTVPPGLSPASLLESPVFLSNAMVRALFSFLFFSFFLFLL